ncbi:MAG: hypothetical protein V1723_01985 [Candidatus Uhrbacteria bacterium]
MRQRQGDERCPALARIAVAPATATRTTFNDGSLRTRSEPLSIRIIKIGNVQGWRYNNCVSVPKLSKLQKAILRLCYSLRGRVERDRFYRLNEREVTKARNVVDVITKTLERLISRGFLVGYGIRTAEKWFIKGVRLTPLGRKVARIVAGEQQRLPLGQQVKIKK